MKKQGNGGAGMRERLAKFEDGRDALRRRLAAVTDALEQARDRRRAFIASNPGAEIAAELRQAIVDAEAEKSAAGEEIADYDRLIAEQRAAVEFEEQRSGRDATAADLERRAAEVDKAGAMLSAAMADVGAALVAIRNALPERGPFALINGARPAHRREGQDEASPREIAGMILAEAVAREMPDMFESFPLGGWGEATALLRFFDIGQPRPQYRFEHGGQPPEAVDAATAARMLASDRLRKLAAEIRSGERALDLGTDAPTIVADPSGQNVDQDQLVS